TPRLLP
ncbi:shikimate dehydrogenase, partial [Vibrio harveyi]